MDALAQIVDEIATLGSNTIHGPRSRQQRGANDRPKPMVATPLSPIAEKRSSRRMPASKRMEPTGFSPASINSAQAERKAIDDTQPNQQSPSATKRAKPAASDAKESSNTIRGTHRSPKSKNGRAVTDDAILAGQSSAETQVLGAINVDDGSRRESETQVNPSPVIAQIISLWRLRQRWHRAEKSLIMQGKAICRQFTNGDKESASELFDAARAAASGATKTSGSTPPPHVMISLAPFIIAIDRFERGEADNPLGQSRKGIEKTLRGLAKSLPVWAWVEQTRGFGDLNLAAIVGEAGDIGSYKSVSALWKRMGLAVIDGIRQRKMTNAEDAAAHGYSPRRRSVAYNLGDTLIKGNGEGKYRSLYLSRKEIEAANPEVKSKAHAHNRAARYMVKRVLRDLYAEWTR